MNGNSIIPTDAEHDAHYADHCHSCGVPFTESNPMFFTDCGFDYCETCDKEQKETNSITPL